MPHPIAATGASLVQIIGLVIVLFGLTALPSAGGVVACILGGILILAGLKKYNVHTQ